MKKCIIAMLSTDRNRKGEFTHTVNYYETTTHMGSGFGMSFWGDDPMKAKRFTKRPSFMGRNQIAVDVDDKTDKPMMTTEEIIAHLGPAAQGRILEFERKQAECRAARMALRKRA